MRNTREQIISCSGSWCSCSMCRASLSRPKSATYSRPATSCLYMGLNDLISFSSIFFLFFTRILPDFITSPVNEFWPLTPGRRWNLIRCEMTCLFGGPTALVSRRMKRATLSCMSVDWTDRNQPYRFPIAKTLQIKWGPTINKSLQTLTVETFRI